MDARPLLHALGLDPAALDVGALTVNSPIGSSVIARLAPDRPEQVGARIARAQDSFGAWRSVPAPCRGELIRLFPEELRAAKDDLGALVTPEGGKIGEEGRGEIQEMIDIYDFAVGL